MVKSIPVIKVGDYVDIKFVGNAAMLKDCRVLYTPVATGDSWIVLDNINNIRYIQNFQEIIRHLTWDEMKNGVTNQRIG